MKQTVKIKEAKGYEIDVNTLKIYNNKGKEMAVKNSKIRLTIFGKRKSFDVKELAENNKIHIEKEQPKKEVIKKEVVKKSGRLPISDQLNFAKKFKKGDKIKVKNYKTKKFEEGEYIGQGTFSCGVYPAAKVKVGKKRKVTSYQNILLIENK